MKTNQIQELEVKNDPTIAQFEIQDLLKIGIVFVVLGIALVYGLNVMEDVKADMNTSSTAYTAAGEAITGVAKFPNKMPLLATVVLAAVMIGILLRYLYVRYA